MRAACLIAIALTVPPAHAEMIAEGFSVRTLGPTLPGGATTSTVTAVAPDGTAWMSNGQTLYELDGVGGIASQVELLQSQGGPVANNQVTSDLAFDAAGAMYITDFGSGVIYKQPTGGSWTSFATLDRPRSFAFDGSGNLIAIGGNGDPTQVGKAWSITPGGVVSEIAPTQGETFAFDINGDLLIPRYDGTGIDRLTMVGDLTNLFVFARPTPILFESIELTAGGNLVVGVNTGWNGSSNTSQLIRINRTTGTRELIGRDVGSAIPVDLRFDDGDLLISGFGSLVPLGVEGDFDGALNLAAVPESSTIWLLALGSTALLLTKSRRSRRPCGAAPRSRRGSCASGPVARSAAGG